MRVFWVALVVFGIAGCGAGDDAGDSVAKPMSTLEIGQDIYNKFCFSCHAAGVAGAPMVGDAEAWVARAAKGKGLLLESTVEGMVPGMPPMGLCMACTNADLEAAIEYMLDASQ